MRPIAKNDFFVKYLIQTKVQIQIEFESREEFEKNFLIATFPLWVDNSTATKFIGKNGTTQIIQLEICKKILFSVKMPFQINWYSKAQVKGLVIKSFLANIPEIISTASIKPIGKIKDKKNLKKDSLTCIVQLTNLQPNGSFTGSIEYQYKPHNWMLSNQWGKKTDIDRKLVQKYTQEQKYWRFPQEFEELIKPLQQINDVCTIAEKVYTLARNTIVAENLEYRKGVLNLLHDMRGDCDEFTDLMVVLLHKLSFPVKRVTGMTYDFLTGKIVHHAWPEIYSPAYDTWIPIDSAMNYFGFQSLTVIPLKIEGSTVIPNQFVISKLDPTQRIDLKSKLLDTEIILTLITN